MNEPTLHTFTNESGRRLAWWQWGDPNAERVVVCVHGLTRQGRDFDAISASLVARAHAQRRTIRVICPDVAGRGMSDPLPDPLAYQPMTYVADTVALLARVHASDPIGSLDWIGTSMGGIMGMIVAGTKIEGLPVPISNLVLNDVGPELDLKALQRIGSYVGHQHTWDTVRQAAGALKVVYASFGRHDEETWTELTRHCLRQRPDGRWERNYDSAIAEPFKNLGTEQDNQKSSAIMWQIWDMITAEVLLIRGADSDLLTRAVAKQMSKRGPLAKFVEFPRVGHAPTLIAKEQQDAVLDFLLPPGER